MEFEFIAKKYHVLEMGKSERKPTWMYKMGDEIITREMKDQDMEEVIVQDLPQEKHISLYLVMHTSPKEHKDGFSLP